MRLPVIIEPQQGLPEERSSSKWLPFLHPDPEMCSSVMQHLSYSHTTFKHIREFNSSKNSGSKLVQPGWPIQVPFNRSLEKSLMQMFDVVWRVGCEQHVATLVALLWQWAALEVQCHVLDHCSPKGGCSCLAVSCEPELQCGVPADSPCCR